MDGPAFVKWIETTLIQNDITKETFYAESGISTANMTQWRAGDYNPSKKSIEKAERFFETKQQEKLTAENGSELSKERIQMLLDKMSAAELVELMGTVTDTLKRKTEG